MTEMTILVTQSVDHWILQAPEQHPKPFATREAALRAALMLCQADEETPKPIKIEFRSGEGSSECHALIVVPGALTFP